MTRERIIRLVAGTFIVVSLALAHWHSPWWLLFTLFVGLNLFQSALTGWCLLEDILEAAKIGEPSPGAKETLEDDRPEKVT